MHYRLLLTCCGVDEGATEHDSFEDASEARDAYASGLADQVKTHEPRGAAFGPFDGHERAAMLVASDVSTEDIRAAIDEA